MTSEPSSSLCSPFRLGSDYIVGRSLFRRVSFRNVLCGTVTSSTIVIFRVSALGQLIESDVSNYC